MGLVLLLLLMLLLLLLLEIGFGHAIGLHESKAIQYFCNYCLALVNS